MRKIFISTIIILSSTSALALGLEEALVSAYNNNEDLKTARQKFVDEIEQFPQALSKFLPDVSARIQKQRTKSKTISNLVSRSSASERDTLQKSVSLDQSLWNGGADMAGLKAAQSAFRASRGIFYDSEQKAILSAIQTFVKYYSAEQKYNISESSVTLNKKQLEATEEKLQLGEATVTDVASARAGYANAEAKKLQSYTDFQAAKAEFVRIFGTEPTDIQLPSVPDKLPPSLEELTKRAMAVNPAMEAARHNVVAAKSGAFAAKANLLPKVNFRVEAGKNIYDPETNNLLSQTLNGLSVTSTIGVTVPIYSSGGAEYSKARKASNQARIAVIGLDGQEKQVKSNCTSAWEGFNASKAAKEAASQGVEAAQLAYEGIVQEELVGSKNILEVLDAETRLQNARSQKVDTEAGYILSAFQMKALIGELTAKSLKLPVKLFEPEYEFKKIKMKIIGF